jgi:MYXO-CTERM domain-containing protein
MRGSTRWLLGLVLVAVPALFFVPGLGFEASHPAALARRTAPVGVWYYHVRQGDSLSTISEQNLGTFKRYKEILALNPAIKPRRLVPDMVLRMPPRTAADAAVPAPPLAQPSAGDTGGLLVSFAALLAVLVLVLVGARRMERRRTEG